MLRGFVRDTGAVTHNGRTHTYIGQASLRAAVLPGRVAYLTAAGSRSGLVRAVQEATTRWAGVTEPIIPVRKGGGLDPWWRQVIDVSNIDNLVNVDAPAADAQTVAKELGLTVIPITDIDRALKGRFSVHPVNLPDEATGRYESRIARRNAALWEIVACGDYTEEHERLLVENGETVTRVVSEDFAARQQVFGTTALDSGARFFGERGTRGGPSAAPTVLYAAKRNSVRDAIFYWNLRALRPVTIERQPMIILPVGEPQHWLQFPEQFASLLRRNDEFSPDVLITGSVAEQELHRLAEALGLTLSSDPVLSGHRFPAGPRTPPYTYRTDADCRAFFVYERQYGLFSDVDVHLFDGPTNVVIPSPIPFRKHGELLLRILSEAFDGLPRRSAVASAIIGNATWRDDALEIATNALDRYRLTINVPTLDAALDLALKEVGVIHKPSDKGRIGTALASRLDVAALREPAMMEVVRAMTSPRSVTLYHDLERHGTEVDVPLAELAAQFGGRLDRKTRTAADLKGDIGKDAVIAAERLASAGWAERGLQVKCTQCGITSFVPIVAVTTPPSCPACAAIEPYAISDTALSVHYRLNGLVGRASDQGVLGHLVTIARLQQDFAIVHIRPGVEVRLPDGSGAEVDILGLADGRIVVGEVKMSGADFTDVQVDRDCAVAQALMADIYVMSAWDHLPDAALKRARDALSPCLIEVRAYQHDDLVS